MVTPLRSLSAFKSAINKDKLVVVDFWATWCGPCRTVSPIIEKHSNDYKDEVEFYKVDVDDVPDVAQECGITAMPTFIYFKNGEKVASVRGADPPAIKSTIEAHK